MSFDSESFERSREKRKFRALKEGKRGVQENMRAQYSFDFLVSSLIIVSLLVVVFSLVYPMYSEIKSRMYGRIEAVISEYVLSECEISRITGQTRILNISSPRAFQVHTSCGDIRIQPGFHTYLVTYYDNVLS